MGEIVPKKLSEHRIQQKLFSLNPMFVQSLLFHRFVSLKRKRGKRGGENDSHNCYEFYCCILKISLDMITCNMLLFCHRIVFFYVFVIS